MKSNRPSVLASLSWVVWGCRDTGGGTKTFSPLLSTPPLVCPLARVIVLFLSSAFQAQSPPPFTSFPQLPPPWHLSIHVSLHALRQCSTSYYAFWWPSVFWTAPIVTLMICRPPCATSPMIWSSPMPLPSAAYIWTFRILACFTLCNGGGTHPSRISARRLLQLLPFESDGYR